MVEGHALATIPVYENVFGFECMERAKTQGQKATSLQPSIGGNASAEVAAVAAEEVCSKGEFLTDCK